MKKKLLLAAVVFSLSLFGAFAQETAPMRGWYYPDEIPFTSSYYLSNVYKEQDGYAIVQGRTLHYWLYNTVANRNGDASEIYNRVIPYWVEKMGYVIDYDNITVYNPNTGLASSVKQLMLQRGCDVSVTLVINTSGRDLCYINEYFASKNSYKTTIYPLYKR